MQLFERVAERMAEIQDHAFAGVVLVVLDDDPLDVHTFIEHPLEIGVIGRETALRERIEQAPAADAAVFDDLAHAVGKIARRQRPERVGVDKHQPRLMERPHQIFALRQVDARLAAHRGIHLRQQRGGDLDKAHPAQERRGGKARHIPHDAAAQRHEEVGAGEAVLRQRRVDLLDHGEPLRRLARREREPETGNPRRFQ